MCTQVSVLLHDPSLAAELQRRPNTFETLQQRLMHHCREDERVPWALIQRELAQIEQDKRQVEARRVAIDQRRAEQQMIVTPREALETYRTQVSRPCERFDLDGKRLALEALDIQVTANGGEWQLHGRMPVDDADVVTQTSGRDGLWHPLRLRLQNGSMQARTAPYLSIILRFIY